jgi:hypothetical protein
MTHRTGHPHDVTRTVAPAPAVTIPVGEHHAGVGRRRRVLLWWRGRRDARRGIPTPEPASFATPTMRELAASAARSHDHLHAVLAAGLVELDAEIAEKSAAIAVLQARLVADSSDRLVADAEALGQPVTSDDAAARARRRAASARAASLTDRARLDGMRIRLAVLLERRERLVDETAARVDAVSSFRDECIEVYRAANLRRRGDEAAAALAEAWHPSTFPQPTWLAGVRTVPTGVPPAIPSAASPGVLIPPAAPDGVTPGAPLLAPAAPTPAAPTAAPGATAVPVDPSEVGPADPCLVTGKA